MTTDYEPLRHKLLEERERIKGLVEAEEHKRATLTDTGDPERYGNHPGDEGTETLEKETSLAMQGNLETILSEVDEALRKFDHGTYGKCEECGSEIPFERLEARPQATMCVQCKSKVEHSQMVSSMEQRQAASRF
ncbi:MAG: TraR/DksA C4-type zinc finger protein [Chloroflexi bacterium]|nr:TraR/DksA C4-type zinc finger protein [Chloroflexota bacterium]